MLNWWRRRTELRKQRKAEALRKRHEAEAESVLEEAGYCVKHQLFKTVPFGLGKKKCSICAAEWETAWSATRARAEEKKTQRVADAKRVLGWRE